MTRQSAVYLAYMLAESLNDPEQRIKLQRLYGTHGVREAHKAIGDIAVEYAFDAPVIATLES